MFSQDAIEYERQYASYAHQVRLIESTGVLQVLQVGVHDGVVSSILRSKGFELTTLDSDPSKKPTVVSDIRSIDAPSHTFELVLCADVLDRIAPEDVRSVLYTLYNLSSKYVLLSVPARYFSSRVEFSSELLRIFTKEKLYRFDFRVPFFLSHHKFEKTGVWKLGLRGTSKRWLSGLIEESGFVIEDSFFVQADEYEFVALLKKA